MKEKPGAWDHWCLDCESRQPMDEHCDCGGCGSSSNVESCDDRHAVWGAEWAKVVFMVVAIASHVTTPLAVSGFAGKVLIKYDRQGYRIVGMLWKDMSNEPA